MKTRVLLLVAVVLVLLATTGCRSYSISLENSFQSGQTVTIEYRIKNLGDEAIVSHTVQFWVQTQSSTLATTANHSGTLHGGSAMTYTHYYNLPAGQTLQSVTISNHSVIWGP